jgi:hypothetical protein
VGVAVLVVATVPGQTAGRLARQVARVPGGSRAIRATPEPYQGRHRLEAV